MNKGKNILITGATGFIGGHITELLIEKGYAVYAMVRRSGRLEELKKTAAHILYGDITRAEQVKQVLEQLRTNNTAPDYIIHAAGATKAGSGEEFMTANCKGTENLLAAISALNIRLEKFIFISSLAASGPQKYGHLIRQEQNKPITNYGTSKLHAEALVRSYTKIPYIILRPTAVYGPGEKDLLTVFRIINYGFNPIVGFNKQELTFIYVKDLVQLILAAMKSNEENKTYFATDGSIYDKTALSEAIQSSLYKNSVIIKLPLFLVKSMAFVSQYASSIRGKQSALNMEKYKELTAQSWNCDVAITFKELNYTPAFNLQKGVKETVKWYKENKWI